MGEVNAQSGRVVAAERNFKDAVELDKKLFGDTAPTASANLQLGAFYAGDQLYAPALGAYREAFRILATNKVARSHVVADQLLPYFDAAAAQAKSPALDNEMFEAAQLVGGGVRDQTIARMAAREAAGTPALAEAVRAVQDAQRARDSARIELAAENSKADEDRDAKRVQTLEAAFAAASKQYDALAGGLAQSFPAYGKLAAPGPTELSAVQHALAPGTALVMYVVGVKGSYALLVKPDGLIVHRIPAQSEALAGDVADLRKAFTPALGRVAPFSLKSSYALYEKLLGPFEGDLSGTQSLIVVPSPELANLPFALLVTQSPAPNQSYGDAAWLIRRMAVSDVPSPRAFIALANAEATRKPAPKPILAFGAPDFTGGGVGLQSLASACLDGGPVAPGILRALPPLPDTAGEVNSVAHALGAGSDSVLLGAAASEASLRARNLSDYGVIYFATHGLLPGELHCQSEPALALSPPAQASSTATDGLLTAGEVAGLDLNADLVVLSACNTASGGDLKSGGAALEGLADAFFDAGARAVLASHWQVPSASTVTLDDGHVRECRRASHGRAGASLAAGPARAHRKTGNSPSLQLGRVHPDRRRSGIGTSTIGKGGCAMKRSIALLVLGFSLVPAAAWAAQLIVVEARGVGYAPGASVDSEKPITLKEGQHLTLVSESGATITLDGPYNQAPGAGAVNGISLSMKLSALAGGGQRFSEVGTTRAAGAASLPSPWLVDASRSGPACVPDGETPVLWREAAAGPTEITITPDDQSWRATIEWPAGDDRLALVKSVPLHPGTTYYIDMNGERHAVSVIAVPATLSSDAMRAAWLSNKGCVAQAQALLRTPT